MMIMTATLTTAEVAAELETTPRELRKFLRSEGLGVNKGSRYALPGSKRELAAMRKKFIAWTEAKAPVADESDETPTED